MNNLTEKELNQLKDDTELNIFRANYCGIISDEERDTYLNNLKEDIKLLKLNQ